LAAKPEWLQAVFIFTPYGLLAVLLSAQSAVAYSVAYKNKRALVIAAACFVPFAAGWMMQHEDVVPEYLAQCVYVPPPRERVHPIDCAQAIDEKIERACASKPNARMLLMPESTYPFPLNENNHAIQMWSLTLGDDRSLILGTHWQEGDDFYNCLCCVNDSRIIHRYVKNHLFWFTEYIPFPWSNCAWIRNLFLKNKQGFSSTEKSGGGSHELPGFSCRFAICSELFFNAYARGPEPLLAMVHDAWFSARYLRDLMFLYARFAAMAKNQEIIYIAHERGVWIGPHGRMVAL